MSPRTQRTVTRWIHLVVGALLNTFVYVAYFRDGGVAWLHTFLVWVGVPLVVITGVAMWQQPRIRRALRQRSTPERATTSVG